MDEKIIELMNEAQETTPKVSRKEASYQDYIMQGVLEGYIELEDEGIEFEEKSLLDSKIKIRIPGDFELMPPEMAALKYPSERRPNPIFTNDSTSVNIAFNHTQSSVSESDMEKFTDAMQQSLKRVQPSAQWFEKGVRDINGKRVGYFDFLAAALDTEVYNLIFFAELDGRALMCSFNCTGEEMEVWEPIAKGVMASLIICSSGP